MTASIVKSCERQKYGRYVAKNGSVSQPVCSNEKTRCEIWKGIKYTDFHSISQFVINALFGNMNSIKYRNVSPQRGNIDRLRG